MSARRFLIDVLVPDWPPLSAADRAAVSDHADVFVRDAIRHAPAPVRVVATAGGVALAWLAFLASGADRVRANQIVDNVAAWGGPFAAVVRLHRSLVVLATYEHPATLAALGVEEPAERQARFRAKRRIAVEGATA